MWTKRPRSTSSAAAALAACVAAVALAAPASADGTPARASTYAGVDVAHLALPGLHLRTRDDRTLEHGGISLAYADDQGEVRAVVRVAVARDAAGAKAFLDRLVLGVSGTLAPSPLDEVALSEPSDHFVVATHGNVGYAIDVQGGSATAGAIAALVKRAIAAPGAPVFPRASVSLPSTFDHAAATPVTLATPAGAHVHVRASGAYVSRDGNGNGYVVHAFAAGAVSVTAIVADDLGRVTETSAAATAR